MIDNRTFEIGGKMTTSKREVLLLVNLTIVLFMILYGFGCSKTNRDSTETTFHYCNPIINSYLADPCIIRSNGDYYLFATGRAPDQRHIPIYRSSDLVQWEFVRGAVARGQEGSWNRKNWKMD